MVRAPHQNSSHNTASWIGTYVKRHIFSLKHRLLVKNSSRTQTKITLITSPCSFCHTHSVSTDWKLIKCRQDFSMSLENFLFFFFFFSAVCSKSTASVWWNYLQGSIEYTLTCSLKVIIICKIYTAVLPKKKKKNLHAGTNTFTLECLFLEINQSACQRVQVVPFCF